jgi:hypothetical protein
MTITDIPQRHSRRAIVAGLAAMIPAATASVAVSTPAHPDAELVALAEQIVNLRFQSEEADAEYARCYNKEMRPKRPRALLWHPTDPVRYQLEGRGNSKATVWCNLDDVEKLRGRTSFIEWVFNGTREQWESLGLPIENWGDKGLKPVVGYEHLFLSAADECRAKRARELLAALDEYNAAEEAADVASGVAAAEEVADAAYARIDELFERMLDLTPSTIEGYRAMASAVVNCCWSGEIYERETSDQRMIAAMFSSLTGVEIKAASSQPG